MKTLLISDIENKAESIIPYSLNFIKFIDDTVTILHVIDPRNHQGVASAYADSQSFEIGRKLTQKEILEREKYQARINLDNLLSKEASKLNYPLRVNTIIEENSIFSRLNTEIGNEPLSLIITSSALNGTVIHDIAEFLELTNQMNNLSLIVPPGYQVSTPLKIIVLYDFNTVNNNNIFKLLKCLKPLKMSVSVANVAEHNKYHEMNIKSEAWKQVANDLLGSSIPITTNILVGKQQMVTAINFIHRNNYDLVAIPHNIKKLSGMYMYPKATTEQLINDLNLPVLLY
jgi:hypothetical protein